MGMIYAARALSSVELRELRADPSLVHRLIAEQTADPRMSLDLDKAWHGIHVLLTGNHGEVDSDDPLDLAILGGTPIGEDVGFGPATLLTPGQVKAVAAALRQVPRQTMLARYDPEAFTAAQVYPAIWDEEDVLDGYLVPYLEDLLAFYRQAAVRGHAVLQMLA